LAGPAAEDALRALVEQRDALQVVRADDGVRLDVDHARDERLRRTARRVGLLDGGPPRLGRLAQVADEPREEAQLVCGVPSVCVPGGELEDPADAPPEVA